MTSRTAQRRWRRYFGAYVSVLLIAACGLAGCSSAKAGWSSANYSFGATTLRIAIPGTPAQVTNPVSFRGLFPSHTSVVEWSYGDMSVPKAPSYELVVVTFKPGTSNATIMSDLASYAPDINTKLYGSNAVDEINFIPPSDYSGIVAFAVRDALVLAVGYDTVRADVARFLSSLKLISPKP